MLDCIECFERGVMKIREVEVLLELALEFVEDIYDDDERERLRKNFKKLLDKGRAKGYKEIVDAMKGLVVEEYVENRIIRKIVKEIER